MSSLPLNNKNNLITVAVKYLLLLFVTVVGLHTAAQKGNPLVLAEKYFGEGDYYTAAGLYEQYLSPGKKIKHGANFPLNAARYKTGTAGVQMKKFDIIYKQAHSYRLANYFPQAADKFLQCYHKDSIKYADALYWYAVCQRSLGDYAKAEKSINLYQSNYANGTIPHEAVEGEKQTIQFIKNQLTRPDTVLYHLLKNNSSVGGEKGIYAGTRINASQFLVTSTHTDAAVMPGTNPNHNRIYYASISNNSIQDLKPVTIPGADPSLNQGAACISPNGNILYFTQWHKVNDKNISAIYYSVKKENNWTKPVLLSSVNKEGFSSKQPFCSPDGKTLFFASNLPGGTGGFDIWMAPLNEDGTTGEPVNAGTTINTTGDEQAPFYHGTSATLVFSSTGRQGMGGYDLFTSKMKESAWGIPENMGHPVNSSRDDIYFFAAEGDGLLKNAMLSSDRGSNCCLETYAVAKDPKKKMITGVVKDKRNNEPVTDALVIMKDASGKTVQTNTGPDGNFSFELTGDPAQNVFTVTKDKYKDKTEGATIEYINEADWLTDFAANAPILMEKKLVIKAENVVTVYFDFDKSDIKHRSGQVLDSIYNVLLKNNLTIIQISGYTDGRGTDEYNAVLSDKRARACASYLIAKGIDASRISFESFGKCCPVEMELINGRDNPDGRSKNRRALINISKPENE